MYLNCKVKIPDTEGKISVKTISGTAYVYYEYTRTYNKDKKYTEPKRTCIGKRDEEQLTFLYPNEKFLKFFFCLKYSACFSLIRWTYSSVTSKSELLEMTSIAMEVILFFSMYSSSGSS